MSQNYWASYLAGNLYYYIPGYSRNGDQGDNWVHTQYKGSQEHQIIFPQKGELTYREPFSQGRGSCFKQLGTLVHRT